MEHVEEDLHEFAAKNWPLICPPTDLCPSPLSSSGHQRRAKANRVKNYGEDQEEEDANGSFLDQSRSLD
jgi:hypothetical protein